MLLINLYLIDISHATNTSGVDRYVSTLINGLRNVADLQVHWIHLRNDDRLLFPKEEKSDITPNTASRCRNIIIPS